MAVLKIIRYSYMCSLGKMQIVTAGGKCRYNCASKGHRLLFINMRTSEMLVFFESDVFLLIVLEFSN